MWQHHDTPGSWGWTELQRLCVLFWVLSLVLFFCLMKSSITESTALISTCPGPNSTSVRGTLLFTVSESKSTILVMSWEGRFLNWILFLSYFQHMKWVSITWMLLIQQPTSIQCKNETSYLTQEKHENTTLRTPSNVTLFISAAAFCELLSCSGEYVWSGLHLQHGVSRGRVFLKTLTIRIFTGNMTSELWTPIMNCCQVNWK